MKEPLATWKHPKYNDLSHHFTFKSCPRTPSNNNYDYTWSGGLGRGYEKMAFKGQLTEHWGLERKSLAGFPSTDMDIIKILSYSQPSVDISS